MKQNPNKTQNTEYTQATKPQATQAQAKWRRNIAIAVMALLAGIGSIVALNSYFNKSKRAETEELEYKALEQNNNYEDYVLFLKKYPESTHKDDVKNRLATLRGMLDLWDSICCSNNAETFRKFALQYNDSKYSTICQIKIDSLDFIAAQHIGTSSAFTEYIEKHPNGMYAAEASVLANNLEKSTVTEVELEQVTAIIRNFLTGLKVLNKDALYACTSDTLKHFMGLSNTSQENILKFIHQKVKNEHIEQWDFIPQSDWVIARQSTASTQPSYIATFNLEQLIINQEGQLSNYYKCTFELNSAGLIESFRLKKQ